MSLKRLLEMLLAVYNENYVVQGLCGVLMLGIATIQVGFFLLNGLTAVMGVIHTIKCYETYKKCFGEKDR